jgi:hypothetical protein
MNAMKTRNPKHGTRNLSGGSSRRGVVAASFLWFLVIGLLVAALVANWAWLVLVQRNMQERADAMALAAAPALLDEDLLRGEPADPSDDVTAAQDAINTYRLLNNDAGPNSLKLQEGDVTLMPGFVTDVSHPFDENTFDGTPPFNTAKVTVQRTSAGGHPVPYLVAGFTSVVSADVSATSVATLDNHVAGFRPTENANAPVMPLAIDRAAWSTQRTIDTNGNDILEMELRLACDPQVNDSNAALVSFDDGLDEGVVLSQLTAGVAQSELPATNELGPATSAMPLAVEGIQQIDPNFCQELADELDDLAAAGECRVFPLYDSTTSGGSNFDLVGFVAARVVSAEMSDNRLKVVVEPCYVIHATTWTDPSLGEANFYIHKLRLVR